MLVTRIYNIVTQRLVIEFEFLEELYNVLVQARLMMSSSQIPTFCSICVKGLEEIHINRYPAIPTLTELIDSLQQLKNQNISFRTKLEKENRGVKNIIRYCDFDKGEDLFQSGYLKTIKSIKSILKENEIQRFWHDFSQSPVMKKYFPDTELERCKSFADDFFAIFYMVISLNKDCNSPNPWSCHIAMIELMEKFQSFSTVGV